MFSSRRELFCFYKNQMFRTAIGRLNQNASAFPKACHSQAEIPPSAGLQGTLQLLKSFRLQMF